MATYEFKDGVLTIEEGARRVRLAWGAAPRALERFGQKAECEFWPDFRILAPLREGEVYGEGLGPVVPQGSPREALPARSAPLLAFREAIEPALVRAVERFPDHQWAMLKLMKVAPRMADLAASSPVLAFCLCSNWVFRRTRPEPAEVQALRYALARQRTIAGFLGFPAREAVVRVLRRIEPESAGMGALTNLRTTVTERTDILEVLGHLPAINRGALGLVTTARLLPLLTPTLVTEVAAMGPESSDIPELLMDIVRVEADLASSRRLGPIVSVDRAREVHESLINARRAETERLARARGRATHVGGSSRRGEFPMPPVPGTPTLIPIATKAELIEEGRTMCHCVANHVSDVCGGHVFVYRMTNPERATLAIVKRRRGWAVLDFRKRLNKKPSLESWQVVNDWLATTPAIR